MHRARSSRTDYRVIRSGPSAARSGGTVHMTAIEAFNYFCGRFLPQSSNQSINQSNNQTINKTISDTDSQ